ncbi:MAG: hypothetical protein R3337_10040 [Gammaproteobacteria bacterium]|nr:hypothetical protein [Gammaproteobacteria bacterium]
MKTFIYRKPVKFSISRLLGLLTLCGVVLLFAPSIEVRMIMAFGVGSAMILILVGSFIAPYFSGLLLEDGRVEQMTGIGGLIVVKIDELDRERSSLSAAGLALVPLAGETLFVPAAEYGRDDILRIAHYVGLSEAGWAQEV